eukprot:8210312-Alexandrium_andersonii.AAC.1
MRSREGPKTRTSAGLEVAAPPGADPPRTGCPASLPESPGIPAEASLDLAHKLLVRELLDDVQVHVVPRKGKVAPVHDALDVELG